MFTPYFTIDQFLPNVSLHTSMSSCIIETQALIQNTIKELEVWLLFGSRGLKITRLFANLEFLARDLYKI